MVVAMSDERISNGRFSYGSLSSWTTENFEYSYVADGDSFEVPCNTLSLWGNHGYSPCISQFVNLSNTKTLMLVGCGLNPYGSWQVSFGGVVIYSQRADGNISIDTSCQTGVKLLKICLIPTDAVQWAGAYICYISCMGDASYVDTPASALSARVDGLPVTQYQGSTINYTLVITNNTAEGYCGGGTGKVTLNGTQIMSQNLPQIPSGGTISYPGSITVNSLGTMIFCGSAE